MNKFYLKDKHLVIKEVINVFNDLSIEVEKKFEFSKLWEFFAKNFDKEASFENCYNEKYTAINFRFMQFLSYFLTILSPYINEEEKAEMLKYLIISIYNEYKITFPEKITFTSEEDIKSFNIILNFINKIKVSQEPLTADNLFAKLF